MSLKLKILLSITILIIAGIACMSYGIIGSMLIINQSKKVENETFSALESASILLKIVRETKDTALAAIDEADEDLLDDITKLHNKFTIIATNIVDYDKDITLQELVDSYNKYTIQINTILRRYLSNDDISIFQGNIPSINKTTTKLNNKIFKYREIKYQDFTNTLSKIRHESTNFQNIFFIIGITLLSVIIGIAINLNNILARIKSLVYHAESLSNGNLQEPIAVDHTDEIGILKQAFEMMRQSLKSLIENLDTKVNERTAELLSAKKEILDILNAIQEGIFTFNHDLTINNEHSIMARRIFNTEIFKNSQLKELLNLHDLQVKNFQNWVNMCLQSGPVLKQWKKYEKLCPVKEIIKIINVMSILLN